MKSAFQLSLIFLMVALLSVVSAAQSNDQSHQPTIIVLNSNPEFNVELGLHGVYELDLEKKIDLKGARQYEHWKSVGQVEVDGFDLAPDARPDGFERLPVWFFAKIKNGENRAGTWRLDTRVEVFNKINIFLVRENGKIDVLLEHSVDDSYSSRPVPGRHISADLNLDPGEQAEIYIHYSGLFHEAISPTISNLDYFYKQRRNDQTISMLYVGLALAAAAFTLLLSSFFGRWISLTFIAYLLCSVGLYLGLTGRLVPYFFPNNQLFAAKVWDTLFYPLLATMVMFGQALIDLKKNAPRYNLLVRAFIGMCAVYSILNFAKPLNSSTWLNFFGYSVLPIFCVLHLTTCWIGVKTRQKGGIPFAISGLIFIALTIAMFFLPTSLTSDFIALHTAHYPLIVLMVSETTAFAVAMAIRAGGVKKERDLAIAAELQSAQDKLHLSEKLRNTETEYERVRLQSNKRRDQLTSVSHDLLQPLTSLRSAIANNMTEDKDKAVEMGQALDYLESLAKENLGANKSGSKQSSKLPDENFSAHIVTDNIARMFKPEAEAKGLEFEYSPLTGMVKTDPVDLMRVLSNLVSNAIKHTEEGRIVLSGHKTEKGLKISVKDTGPGMSEEEIETYLAPYEKGSKSKGTGLGLHLVKTKSDEQGYKFEIESTPGKGTCASVLIEGND